MCFPQLPLRVVTYRLDVTSIGEAKAEFKSCRVHLHKQVGGRMKMCELENSDGGTLAYDLSPYLV